MTWDAYLAELGQELGRHVTTDDMREARHAFPIRRYVTPAVLATQIKAKRA